jgi:hypothetical protein
MSGFSGAAMGVEGSNRLSMVSSGSSTFAFFAGGSSLSFAAFFPLGAFFLRP